MSEEEILIGTHESGITLTEGANTSLSRNYCANCKRMIHCYVKIDKDTKEAKIHNTCKSSDCECKCRTHWECKQCGFLHPYGEKSCTRVELVSKTDSANNKNFNKIMDDWKNLQKSKKHNIQGIKP